MEEEREELLLRLPSDSKEREGLLGRVRREEQKLWVVAGPAVFTRMSTFGVSVVSLAFMGHIGSVELAAYALVFTVLIRFANGVLMGMSSALQTLCGQSYGAGQYYMLGIYLQRSWLILLPFTILLIPIFVFTTPILTILGQDKTVAKMAGTISFWFIPVLFAYGMSFTLQMYLQSQSKNMVITYWAALTLCVHIFLSWFMALHLQLGVSGVMGSTVIALWIPVIGQLIFVFCGGCPETWKGFSGTAFKDLWPAMKLFTSSSVMVCLEFWYNSILVLLTGHMQDAEVAIDALSICININSWELMLSFGLMAAAGVRVANGLGAGSAPSAKFSIAVVVSTSATIGLVVFIALLLLRGKVAYVFTESPEVARAVAELSPLLAFSVLLNSVQPVLSGVAIGAGWQSIVAYVNIACYYFIGIPLGVIFGYVVGLGVKGVWMGMIFGVACQTLVLALFTWKTDWDKQVATALARVRRWSLSNSDDANNGDA